MSPEFNFPLGAGNITLRADWSYRDDMFGEPSSDPGRFTHIDSRDLINFDVTYQPTDGDWSVSAYGKNVTDERYDNARLNMGGLHPRDQVARCGGVRGADHEGVLSRESPELALRRGLTQAGWMFAFSRNRFIGSYWRFSCLRRPMLPR